MDEGRAALLELAMLVEPGTSGVAELVGELGPTQALSWVRKRTGRSERWEPAATLAQAGAGGMRVVFPGDPEFPTQLMDLPEPPLALWVRGPLDLRAAALRSVAVVGARASTAYGERVAGDLSAGLAARGWAVVSGAAFGIDAAAHRGALSADGATIAVVACGVDVAYPRAHEALLSRICDQGLVVSELPPGSRPLKHRFLLRNRLIAALTRGTVVVEASRRSGALATASRASELARDVMAVPGPITSMASAGANRLLRERQGVAVCDVDEVEATLLARPEYAGPQPASQAGGPDAGVPADLGADPARVLAVLPRRGGADVEAVARRLGMEPLTCLAHLGILEIRGLARRGPGGWRRD